MFAQDCVRLPSCVQNGTAPPHTDVLSIYARRLFTGLIVPPNSYVIHRRVDIHNYDERNRLATLNTEHASLTTYASIIVKRNGNRRAKPKQIVAMQLTAIYPVDIVVNVNTRR